MKLVRSNGMKMGSLLVIIGFGIGVGMFGCSTEAEKIHKAQVETCITKTKDKGEIPSVECQQLVPELRQYAVINNQSTQPQQPYYPQDPQGQIYAPQQAQGQVYSQPQAPVVVQQTPVQQGMSTGEALLLGGMAGHM